MYHLNIASLLAQTDTADEKSDLDDGMGESAEAAEALMALAGAAVNGRARSTSSSSTTSSSSSSSAATGSTGEEMRSPVLMEHSYCLPWAPKDSTQVTFLPPGKGQTHYFLFCVSVCVYTHTKTQYSTT